MKKLLLLLLLALPTIGEAQMCMRWELVCKELPSEPEHVLVWIDDGENQNWWKALYSKGHFFDAYTGWPITKYVTNWMRIYPPASVCPAPTPPEPDGGPLE